MQKNLEAHYNEERNTWIVDVPFGLSTEALSRITAHLYRINHDRWQQCGPGDKKEYFGRGVKALTENRVEQRITKKGENTFFASTERERTDRAFSLPPVRPALLDALGMTTPTTQQE